MASQQTDIKIPWRVVHFYLHCTDRDRNLSNGTRESSGF